MSLDLLEQSVHAISWDETMFQQIFVGKIHYFGKIMINKSTMADMFMNLLIVLFLEVGEWFLQVIM